MAGYAAAGGRRATPRGPVVYTLSRRPAIRVVEGMVSPEEVRVLDALGGAWSRFDAAGIAPEHDATGFSLEMPRGFDPAVEAVASRIEGWLGVPDALGEHMRFRRYSVGEAHPPHLDTYQAAGLTLVATAMLCLTAPAVGGQTRFPRAEPGPLALQAAPGRLLVWSGHLPDGRPDPASLHDAAPVVAGQKSTLTLFVYRPERFIALPEGIDLTANQGRPR